MERKIAITKNTDFTAKIFRSNSKISVALNSISNKPQKEALKVEAWCNFCFFQ